LGNQTLILLIDKLNNSIIIKGKLGNKFLEFEIKETLFNRFLIKGNIDYCKFEVEYKTTFSKLTNESEKIISGNVNDKKIKLKNHKIPSIFSLNPKRHLYMGTFSKEKIKINFINKGRLDASRNIYCGNLLKNNSLFTFNIFTPVEKYISYYLVRSIIIPLLITL